MQGHPNIPSQDFQQEIVGGGLGVQQRISFEAIRELQKILLKNKITEDDLEVELFADYILTIGKHSVKL